MTLPRQTLHLPFERGPHRMALGLVARDFSDLIEIDERYVGEMALRRALLDGRRDDVFGAEPGSEAARAAALQRIAASLAARWPSHFAAADGVFSNLIIGERWSLRDPELDPLEVAARLVQEDLCLIDVSGEAPRLAAATLCMPSRWRLSEKLGRPLADVHGPVPAYQERLSAPVDRFMRQIKPGRLAARSNWSLHDDPALFQPARRRRMQRSVTPGNAGQAAFLRVERQTLSRLDDSATVLFTIRTHVYPLRLAAAEPEAAALLADAIRAVPPDLAAYKGLPPIRAAALAWLDTRSRRVVR